MEMKTTSYEEVRKEMQPGDVIAFGGEGPFSETIKWATRSEVSHVGVILQTRVRDCESGRFFNEIIESTSLHGFNGVATSRFSDRVCGYEGEIWWLPLNKASRDKLDQDAYYDFLFNQAKNRKQYDMPQAIKSALDTLDLLPFGAHGPGYNREDFSKFFCSELVAAGLEKAGVVGSVNASEVTPIDLCRWNIYSPTYFQLKGDSRKGISRYNTTDPRMWDT